MNRLLVIPAGCCLIAYGAVFAVLHGGSSESVAAPSYRTDALPAVILPPASPPQAVTPAPLLSVAEAEQVLQEIQARRLKVYGEWGSAPHQMYSRARVEPVGPYSLEYAIAPCRPGEHELLATLTLKVGRRSQTIPCVIDRVNKGVGVFWNGKWTDAETWLAAAPLW